MEQGAEMKSEIRNSKSERSPKSEIRKQRRPVDFRFSGFGLRISFGFRPSDFGIEAKGNSLKARTSFRSLLPGKPCSVTP